jgi:Holliday junction resolvase RusA-like endonuclease
MIHLTLLGQVPSLKNRKQLFIRGGKPAMVSNKLHRDWEIDALWQLKGKAVVTDYPATLTCIFYNGDKRKRDNSNMLDSVQDVLVKAGILEDDNCWLLDVGGLHSEYDKDNPRVEIFFE